jgi:hypothetical protein
METIGTQSNVRTFVSCSILIIIVILNEVDVPVCSFMVLWSLDDKHVMSSIGSDVANITLIKVSMYHYCPDDHRFGIRDQAIQSIL